MNRVRCAQLVKDRLDAKDIVICGLGSVEDAYKQVGPAGPTYFASDPMGLWPSIALGLALARPDRRVIFLAGDGDLLMNLQVLSTIAAAAPTNLRIVLFQNNCYASSGGQALASASALSFGTIAKGSGFGWTAESRSEEETVKSLDELFRRDQLGFVAVHLEADKSPSEQPGPWSQAEERAQFMRQLQS